MSSLSEVLGELGDLQGREQDFCVLTVVRAQAATAAKAGHKAIVTSDGELRGFVGGMCVQGAARRAAAEALRTGRPKLIRVKPSDEVQGTADRDGVELHKSGCPSRGTVDLFIEPVKRPPRLLLIGSSAVAVALARHAPLLGYATRLLSGSKDLPADLPDAVDAVPGLAAAQAAGLRAEDYVVVATQGQRDLSALQLALATPAAYVALVASKKKTRHLLAKLDRGKLTARQIKRLKYPAGLDIKGVEPAEIAISILAEIISRRRQPQD